MENAFQRPEASEIMEDVSRFSNKATDYPGWPDNKACL